MSYETLIIPNGTKELEREDINKACYKEEIKEIILPDSIEYIHRDTFSRLRNLEKINFPKNLKYIDDYAFSGCDSLKNIELNEGLVSIGKGAFGCCDIKKVYIPKSVDKIGRHPFIRNKNLKEIIVDKENKKFSDCNCNTICRINGTYFGVPYRTWNILIQGCLSSKIPDNIDVIEASAFDGMKIEEIEIPESVERICNYAFYNCNIKKLTLNNGITGIGANAFCKNKLEYIKIPSSVEVIDEEAFLMCNLKEIVIKGDTYIRENAFSYNNLEAIYIYSPNCVLDDNIIDNKSIIIYTLNDLEDNNSKERYKKQILPLTLDTLIAQNKTTKQINDIYKNIER